VSFNLSEELVGNRSNKGSKLFNARRAKSEEPEERSGETTQLRKFGGSQFHLERPSRLVAAATEAENGGQPATQQSRLRELIEEYNVRRSPFDAGDDYSSVGMRFKNQEWSTGPAGGREREWVVERSASSGSIDRDFSTKFSHKKRANFRPVRFKAPEGFGSMQPPVQTTQSDELEDEVEGPVSDF
jgi:hypothetical protein